MASEYLKWKYQDVKPDAPVEHTREEERRNWWYYHKWHVLIAIAIAAICFSIIWSALGIGQVKPDYQFAYVGTDYLPESTVSALESALAALGTDQNGDGVVTVSVHQYPCYSSDPQLTMASQARLMADLSECSSCFFLLDDPDRFQDDFHILSHLDGSLPAGDERSAEGTCLPWSQCPVLAGMDLGEYSLDLPGGTVTGDSAGLLSRLSLARRGFWTKQTVQYPEACEALWAVLTQGAVS